MKTNKNADCIAWKKRIEKLIKNNEKMIKSLTKENVKGKKIIEKIKC